MKLGRERVVNGLLAIVVLLPIGLGATAASAAEWGPDDALSPSGDWDHLEPGQSSWYAFQYLGDGSRIEIALQMEPDASAGFSVWTPDQIRRWGQGEYVEPVGRGYHQRRVRAAPAGRVGKKGRSCRAGLYVRRLRACGQPGRQPHLLVHADAQ